MNLDARTSAAIAGQRRNRFDNLHIEKGYDPGHRYPTCQAMKKSLLVVSVALVANFSLGTLANAQSPSQAYPARPITLVVPYPPGGAADILGRIMGRALAAKLGVNVIVDNKAGAGTALGAQIVAQAVPDGYTLLVSGNTTYTINPALKSRLPYDPVNGFAPIGIIGHTALVMLAHPSVQAQSLKEVIALANQQPGKLNYGSFGVGTSSHFAGEIFKVMSGTQLNHVPYKGSAPLMTDLIGGQIPFSFDTTVAAAAQAAAGKVKPIAVTSKKRAASMPSVPTMAESGLPNYDLVAWLAIVGPKALPDSVQTTLSNALAAAMKDPATIAELTKAGLEIDYHGPKAYHERVARELPLLRAFVHKAGIVVE